MSIRLGVDIRTNKKHMKKTTKISLVVAGVIILSGCSLYGSGSNNSSGTMAPLSSSATTQSAQSAVATNSVNIQNFAFSPAVITIKAGTTVTWTNNDSAMHKIKADTFNSGNLSKGDTFQFTFNTLGTFDYSCAIHPSMTGKIVVE